MPRTPIRPLIVVDWNIIQTAGHRGFDAPRGHDLLVPDEAVQEALRKPDAKSGNKPTAPASLRSLLGLCYANRSRVWIAWPAYPHIRCCRSIGIREIVCRQFGLRTLRNDPGFFVSAGRAYSGYDAFEDCRADFTACMADVRKDQLRFDSQIKRNDREIERNDSHVACARTVLQAGWCSENKAWLSLTDAQIANLREPLPCSRWQALYSLYALRGACRTDSAKARAEDENNFSDAVYAFLSSYTGHLLTHDTGCQQAARMLRPDVQIWILDACTRRISISSLSHGQDREGGLGA